LLFMWILHHDAKPHVLLMTYTLQGHTMEVTGVAWHPIDKNIVLTSSLDGSVRIWDLLGESTFGNLCSKHVRKSFLPN
jgi:WD40 repeat protein